MAAPTVPPRSTPFTAPKQTKKRTSGYDSYDSLQSLNDSVNKGKTIKPSETFKMTAIDEKKLNERKPKQSKTSHTTTPTVINKNDTSTKPAPLTKSNVAKFSLSQTNTKKRSRAWDDDSAVDFSKLM